MTRTALLATFALFLLSAAAYSQAIEKPPEAGPIRSSAAYAEVVLRRTELQAELESLIPDYTEANPKILDLRFEIGALDRALEKIYSVKPSETGKLTLALGRLIVKRASVETELARLSRSYTNETKEVKRARRRVEIYDAAVKEILP
jgi:Skp family chaperone for outer membrane proteins